MLNFIIPAPTSLQQASARVCVCVRNKIMCVTIHYRFSTHFQCSQCAATARLKDSDVINLFVCLFVEKKTDEIKTSTTGDDVYEYIVLCMQREKKKCEQLLGNNLFISRAFSFCFANIILLLLLLLRTQFSLSLFPRYDSSDFAKEWKKSNGPN